MRWSGVSKSSTPRLVTTRRSSWCSPHPVAELGGAVVAEPRHDVDLLDEHPRRVLRDPVAGGVVDRVARARRACRAAAPSAAPGSPMQAMFWLPYRSICDAPIITWRRPDHTTSNIVRYGFHASIGLVGVVDAERDAVGDEQRLAVGHHEVGLEHVAGEPAAERRDRARSGWPGSRRRRGTHSATRDHARTSARRSTVGAHSPTTFRYSAWSPQSRYFAFHAAHASGSLALAAYSFWNASSRP